MPYCRVRVVRRDSIGSTVLKAAESAAVRAAPDHSWDECLLSGRSYAAGYGLTTLGTSVLLIFACANGPNRVAGSTLSHSKCNNGPILWP